MPTGPFHTSLVPPTRLPKEPTGTAETRLDLSQKSKSSAGMLPTGELPPLSMQAASGRPENV